MMFPRFNWVDALFAAFSHWNRVTMEEKKVISRFPPNFTNATTHQWPIDVLAWREQTSLWATNIQLRQPKQKCYFDRRWVDNLSASTADQIYVTISNTYYHKYCQIVVFLNPCVNTKILARYVLAILAINNQIRWVSVLYATHDNGIICCRPT